VIKLTKYLKPTLSESGHLIKKKWIVWEGFMKICSILLGLGENAGKFNRSFFVSTCWDRVNFLAPF